MAFGKKYFDVESDLEFKECLRKCNDEDTLAFMKAVPQAIGSGFTGKFMYLNLVICYFFEKKV